MKEPLIRRVMNFDFSKIDPFNWTYQGLLSTQVVNALSILLPQAERVMIDAMRDYKNSLSRSDDEELIKEISDFVYQEANHARFHIDFNNRLATVIDIDRASDLWDRVLLLIRKMPKSLQFSIFAGFEHITFMLGELGYDPDGGLKYADQEAKRFWAWHGLEEIEHKNTCFDINSRVNGNGLKGYAIRQSGYIFIISAFFASYLRCFYVSYLSVIKNPKTKNTKTIIIKNITRTNKPGIMKTLSFYLNYFKPDYHPSK